MEIIEDGKIYKIKRPKCKCTLDTLKKINIKYLLKKLYNLL